MRSRVWEECDLEAAKQRMRGRGGVVGHTPSHGANDGPVPNETGNAVRNPWMARNKGTAPVALRGKSVESLICAGRGEAYSPEAGRAEQLRSKERARRTMAGSNPAPSPYRSKLDAAFAAKLELEVKAGLVKAWRYEPMSFTLAAGKRYRPDFMIQYPDGLERRLEFVEVKGYHPNRRDSLTHLAWCAQRYPMFVWKLVTREKGHWEEREIS